MWTKKFSQTKYSVSFAKTDKVLKTIEAQCEEFAKFHFGARKTDCFYEATTAGINTFYVRETDNVYHIVAKVTVTMPDKATAKKPTYKVENWYTDISYSPKAKDGSRTTKTFTLKA